MLQSEAEQERGVSFLSLYLRLIGRAFPASTSALVNRIYSESSRVCQFVPANRMPKYTYIIYFASVVLGAPAGAQDTGFNLTLRQAEARHVVLEIENHSGADVYWYDYFVNKTHRLSASIFEFPKEVEEPPI